MSTYFIINIAIVVIPLLFSFDKKVRFYKKLQFALPAILITGVVFIVWDALFTAVGIWSFSPRHLSGIRIFDLPVEEILFFITVPYSGIFTYETLKTYQPQINPKKNAGYISFALATLLFATGIYHYTKWYTCITFISLSIAIILLQFILKSQIMGRFYIAYAIIIFPFLLFNGLLTGSFLISPVVLYNDMMNMGLKIFSIPVEDAFYGMLLMLINISLFEAFRRKLRAEPLTS